jgi:hypothetical protein
MSGRRTFLPHPAEQPGGAPAGGGGIGNGSGASFVFRPGGTPEANVYTTEASLAAATQALHGAAYTIVFDLSLVSGTYAFTTVGQLALGPNGTWTDGGAGYTIVFANGTTLHGDSVPTLLGTMFVQISQSNDVITLLNESQCVVGGEITLEQTSASSGAWVNFGDLYFALYVKDNCYVTGFPGAPNPLVYGTVACSIIVLDATGLGPYSVPNAVPTFQGTILAGSTGCTIDSSLYPVVMIFGLYVDDANTAVLAGGIDPTLVTNKGQFVLSQSALWQSNGATWVKIT